MKNLKNRKGFTLIELLAVIIILAVLMMIAIPAMNRIIENSRKKTFVSNAQYYTEQISYNAMSGLYDLPSVGKALVVGVETIELQHGEHRSTFGADYVSSHCFVVVVNNGTIGTDTQGEDRYIYFVAMLDAKGNGFSLTEESSLQAGHVKKGTLTTSSFKGMDSYSQGQTIAVGDLQGISGLKSDGYVIETIFK